MYHLLSNHSLLRNIDTVFYRISLTEKMSNYEKENVQDYRSFISALKCKGFNIRNKVCHSMKFRD